MYNKDKEMKWGIIILIIIAVIFGFLNWNKNKETKQIKIGATIINVEVVDTEAKREQGLSGREGLAENEGMLFVFEGEGSHGFWMKDMNFAIDIAWIDKNKKIVLIEKNISPETYPEAFGTSTLSLYVLEVSAQFLERNNIKIGDFVDF